MRRARQTTRGTRRSMPKPTLLYAWAVPVPALPFLDHTWVTSYDNRLTPYPDDQQVAAAGALYWYCWGDFHRWGGTPNHPTGSWASSREISRLPSVLCKQTRTLALCPQHEVPFLPTVSMGYATNWPIKYSILPASETQRHLPSAMPAGTSQAFLSTEPTAISTRHGGIRSLGAGANQ